jgi:type III secretion protein J
MSWGIMKLRSLLWVILTLSLCACNDSKSIVTGVDEREANVIVVFLQSKGIQATKEPLASGQGVGGDGPVIARFNINVDASQAIDAMSILNSNGLPRRQGTTLLDLFGKPGLMSTDKEETIRYQAGLSQQLANMILLIDGVIDATVQLSFPDQAAAVEGVAASKITAAVFVKHQGIIDDPNSHLENKIKRLVSGSINGLDINDVTVVSDRSRFTDVSTSPFSHPMGNGSKEYVKIWSMTLSKESLATFRVIFFLLLIISLALAVVAGWALWKIYPLLRKKGGFKEFLNPVPFLSNEVGKKEEPVPESNEL